MRIGNLGRLGSTWPTSVPDSPTCGPNPCTWIDNTGSVIGESSQACADFMQCALPDDPTTIALNKSLVSGVATAVGEDVGSTVGDVASGVAGGFAGGLSDKTNFSGFLLLGGVLVLGIFLLKR